MPRRTNTMGTVDTHFIPIDTLVYSVFETTVLCTQYEVRHYRFGVISQDSCDTRFESSSVRRVERLLSQFLVYYELVGLVIRKYEVQ